MAGPPPALPADLLRPNRVASGNLAKMSQQKRGRASTAWMSLAGLGLEFAAAVAGFAALGWWLDREFGTEPTALLICVALGLIGGMYNLIRQSLKAARRAEEERKHKGSSGEQDRLS